MFQPQSITISAASMEARLAATSSAMRPLPLKPKLSTSRPRLRPMTLVKAMPGRVTTPPCAMDVPYHTTGLPAGA